MAVFPSMPAIHGVPFFCPGGSPRSWFCGLGRCYYCLQCSSVQCGTVLRCGQCPWVTHVSLFRSRRPFIWASIMSFSVSSSRSSKVLVFLGWGELALGSVSKFLATLASHDVAWFSFVSSSILKFLREGGVTNSIRGIFSLLELK